MDNRSLKMLSIISSVLGLVILFLVVNQPSTQMSIESITIEDVGRQVKICGEVESKTVSNNHIFFTVGDSTGSMKIVIFNTTAIHLNESKNSPYEINIGNSMCAPGIISEYPENSGELEIIYRLGIIEVFR
ncbi:MAG: OB-fold nucleic acid binding domain-containing protein [Candidatus Aenigmatarchaeota archaeon]